ncbi:MAG TPA: hypothetical protein VIR56_11885 [Solimonas sp.]
MMTIKTSFIVGARLARDLQPAMRISSRAQGALLPAVAMEYAA